MSITRESSFTPAQGGKIGKAGPPHPRESLHNLSKLKKSIVSPDKKSLSGLVGILKSFFLSEITNKDHSLPPLKRTLPKNDYEEFI